ncbi:hypothetical protein ACFOZZ_03900 [Catenibacterium sp. GCM10023432]|uniref:hypothetical protein n=1 Tax=Catenibacterium sp. GCM10023432 TaxID=3252638 RepID=UPI0036187064
MYPILLRNDGPIENDIKPYCLDGKDIKTALEDIKNSLLFLSDKIEGEEEVKVIELLTNLIYLRNSISPKFVKCTKSELDKLYKNYKVEVISEDCFSKVNSNRDFLKEINDRTDYIFFNKKRKLTTRIKVFDEEKSIERQRDYEKEVDVILDPDKVYSPIDMNNRVNELSYQEFLRKNIIYKLNRVPLDRMLSLKKDNDMFADCPYFYDIDVSNMFCRKYKTAEYYSVFNEYHNRINNMLDQQKDDKYILDQDSLLRKKQYNGYAVFKSDDKMTAKDKASLFYDICSEIDHILKGVLYTYKLSESLLYNNDIVVDEENISVEFFKKFNYFTTMYDWEEFKDIENKPKKVDILNAFLYSYMLACKINKKNQEENKAMKQKHSKEPSNIKFPELKRLDPGSKMYDKYNCEFIRELAGVFEKVLGLNRAELIIKFSMLYTIPIINSYNNELNELGVAELTASISDSNKMTTRNMKQLKTIVKQLRKQLIRLGYIYFTFFRFIDSKNFREYDIGFTNFLEYINFNIECDEPKKWYLLIMGFYKDYTEEHKDLIVSFFKMPSLCSILESYFDLCEKLYLICDYMNENPFNTIMLSKNGTTIYDYKKKDWMGGFQDLLSRNTDKILNEKGDESYER